MRIFNAHYTLWGRYDERTNQVSYWSTRIRVSKLTDYPDAASEVRIIEPDIGSDLYYSPSNENIYLSEMVGGHSEFDGYHMQIDILDWLAKAVYAKTRGWA